MIDFVDAATATVRDWCGWHVTPQETVTITVDGPGTPLLVLPTLRLVALLEVVEDGVVIDIADLHWSTRGQVRKRGGGRWTSTLGGITATITHGFESAPGFDAAVQQVAAALARDPSLASKRVDDVEHRWIGGPLSAVEPLIARYRILQSP